jgi:hypothetical protein
MTFMTAPPRFSGGIARCIAARPAERTTSKSPFHDRRSRRRSRRLVSCTKLATLASDHSWTVVKPLAPSISFPSLHRTVGIAQVPLAHNPGPASKHAVTHGPRYSQTLRWLIAAASHRSLHEGRCPLELVSSLRWRKRILTCKCRRWQRDGAVQ